MSLKLVGEEPAFTEEQLAAIASAHLPLDELPQPRVAAAPKPTPEPISKAAAEALAAMASVLTVRLVLALVVAISGLLAWRVGEHPSLPGLVALGVFAVQIVPLVWLSQKRVT